MGKKDGIDPYSCVIYIYKRCQCKKKTRSIRAEVYPLQYFYTEQSKTEARREKDARNIRDGWESGWERQRREKQQSRQGWMVTFHLFWPAQPLRSVCDGEERWQPAPEAGV